MAGSPSDRELVQRARDGAPDDYRLLVERYQRVLFAFLAARVRDRTLAEDAAQESLVRAFFALGKLKKPESFYAWLLGIAGRVAHEFQRSADRTVPMSDPEPDQPPEPVPLPEPDPPLEEAVAALPEVHRRLILLRYYEGLSCQEIAERTGMPLGTVTKTLSRAYAELRTLLKGMDQKSGTRVEVLL